MTVQQSGLSILALTWYIYKHKT